MSVCACCLGQPCFEALADGAVGIAYTLDHDAGAGGGLHDAIAVWHKCFEAGDWPFADVLLPEPVLMPIGIQRWNLIGEPGPNVSAQASFAEHADRATDFDAFIRIAWKSKA